MSLQITVKHIHEHTVLENSIALIMSTFEGYLDSSQEDLHLHPKTWQSQLSQQQDLQSCSLCSMTNLSCMINHHRNLIQHRLPIDLYCSFNILVYVEYVTIDFLTFSYNINISVF